MRERSVRGVREDCGKICEMCEEVCGTCVRGVREMCEWCERYPWRSGVELPMRIVTDRNAEPFTAERYEVDAFAVEVIS